MPRERGLSLTKQLLGAFALFSLALLVTYALVVPYLVLSTEDRIFARQLEEHVQLARAEIDAGRTFEAHPAPGVRVAVDGAGFDPAIAAWIGSLEPGRHEFNDEAREGTDEREFFVAVEELEGKRRLQVVYEVGAYEGMEGLWDRDYLTTIGVGTLVALAASLLGMILVGRLSRSLRELERLGAASPLDAEAGREASLRGDEVGRIARSWRAASERSREALEREQRFTRDASHELRTPITAALGALENLEYETNAEPERREQLLARTRRALGEMEDLVTGFLWLAREARPGDEMELLPVAPELATLLEEQESRARTLGLQLVFEGAGDLHVAAPRSVVRIVLGNLLRNAVAHSDEGQVHVALDERGVTVTNPLFEGEEPRSGEASFGFGLTIVRDLCRRFGWSLELGTAGGENFVAKVVLAPLDSQSS